MISQTDGRHVCLHSSLNSVLVSIKCEWIRKRDCMDKEMLFSANQYRQEMCKGGMDLKVCMFSLFWLSWEYRHM